MIVLVQKWPFKNEFIDLNKVKISKNCNIKSVTFQTYSKKYYPKIINTLVAIQFKSKIQYLVSLISNFTQNSR
jgi:hypothetical protein